MIYAMLYAENADIVGTYDSFEAAAQDLAEFVNAHPHLQDEIGLRRYADGKPLATSCRRPKSSRASWRNST